MGDFRIALAWLGHQKSGHWDFGLSEEIVLGLENDFQVISAIIQDVRLMDVNLVGS
jgi:hypothetical protein